MLALGQSGLSAKSFACPAQESRPFTCLSKKMAPGGGGRMPNLQLRRGRERVGEPVGTASPEFVKCLSGRFAWLDTGLTIAFSGMFHMRCWLRSRGSTDGVHKVLVSASRSSRKMSVAAPQYSEFPTQPVSAVAIRTAFRQRVLARSSGTPAFRAYQGSNLGAFICVSPCGRGRPACAFGAL